MASNSHVEVSLGGVSTENGLVARTPRFKRCKVSATPITRTSDKPQSTDLVKR
ncbi:hypothetical protein J1N35_040564 [Gossypium stocksii]|uniref:Uncharacterized protein n=1 Tax=Gossypium stocksii TaxID=47602 RepID=A0A9D3UE26_9ROSI|nr:hypothetical protein J1N35_040564 [Gossypium stocksii]